MTDIITTISLEDQAEVVKTLVTDLRLLCRLHDREIDGELLSDLCQNPVQAWFGLAIDSPEARAGFNLITQALATVPCPPDRFSLDALAADYADIYLTFGARAAPNESYWMTEEHLERQEPMFAVREWYAHYGMAVRDWRKRADDHLVHEMQFITDLLELPETYARIDAARFMDSHLLAWVSAFCAGVAARAGTPFYAGLALITMAYLQAMRDALEMISGEARQPSPPLPEDRLAQPEPETGAYHPGAGPGW